MLRETKALYEFGPFRLEPAERVLEREGAAVPLAPKAFDLLLVLVERHGHLVEKDELLKLVWPDTFVEETNLTYNISVLRKALGRRDGRLEVNRDRAQARVSICCARFGETARGGRPTRPQ